ncbi:MAG TPA: ATP-binding protein, partial [Methylomicrobium sp.]|nr:ATP-binding protein [Methylomicrobium sp.]
MFASFNCSFQVNQLLKFDVLIIDELGYLPMNKQGMHNLFQLI